ncbi:MAG: helix-turn-helix transcriptional regulator [Chloroflexi bacterium]|nr:helix-turn-helix transcriptional regulator [Chloroflexota bacterium]
MDTRARIARISALIQARRRERGLGLRAAAQEAGISPSTLSRLERAAATTLPDAETLTRLATWLAIPLTELLSSPAEPTPGEEPTLSTPEVVEVHLRADKHLSPETAAALARAFRTLYEQFVTIEEQARPDDLR